MQRMTRKIAIFAFNGDPMYFSHVMLNCLDMAARGHNVRLIIEGEATTQVKNLYQEESPFSNLYKKLKDAGLIDCVCQACSAKFGAQQSALDQGLRLCSEMSGHPSVARYLEAGYEVLIF